jgi:hypothetical protein
VLAILVAVVLFLRAPAVTVGGTNDARAATGGVIGDPRSPAARQAIAALRAPVPGSWDVGSGLRARARSADRRPHRGRARHGVDPLRLGQGLHEEE